MIQADYITQNHPAARVAAQCCTALLNAARFICESSLNFAYFSTETAQAAWDSWSALVDDFRTFLLGGPTLELAISAP